MTEEHRNRAWPILQTFVLITVKITHLHWSIFIFLTNAFTCTLQIWTKPYLPLLMDICKEKGLEILEILERRESQDFVMELL